MNIAVWGTKQEAVYLLNEIEADNQNEVVCFIDNDDRKWGG